MTTIDQLIPNHLDLSRLTHVGSPTDSDHGSACRLSALVLHDDLQAVRRARELIRSIADRLPTDAEICPTFVQFDELETSEAQEDLSKAMAGAGLLILSASSDHEPPEVLVDIWRNGLAGKRGGDAAAVVLLAREGCFECLESPRLSVFRKAAEDSGVGFFAPGPLQEHRKPDTAESVHDREVAMTPTLYGILHHAEHASGNLFSSN